MGDWIKVDHDLPTKPEVQAIAEMCRMSRYTIIGYLIELWIWADKHTFPQSDRVLVPRGGLTTIAKVVGVPQRVLRAMCAVGWLQADGDCVVFPGLRKWMSRNKKERERKQQSRQTSADKMRTESGHVSAQCPQKVATGCGQNADALKDKKREENTTGNKLALISPPAEAGEAPDADDVWHTSDDQDDTSTGVDTSHQPPPDGTSRDRPRRRAGRRDPEHASLFAAIRDVTGLDTSRPRSCKRIEKAIRELREADPPYRADDVRRLGELFQELGWTATPEAIAKHIDLVRKPAKVNGDRRGYYERLYRELDAELTEWVRRREANDAG